MCRCAPQAGRRTHSAMLAINETHYHFAQNIIFRLAVKKAAATAVWPLHTSPVCCLVPACINVWFWFDDDEYSRSGWWFYYCIGESRENCTISYANADPAASKPTSSSTSVGLWSTGIQYRNMQLFCKTLLFVCVRWLIVGSLALVAS